MSTSFALRPSLDSIQIIPRMQPKKHRILPLRPISDEKLEDMSLPAVRSVIEAMLDIPLEQRNFSSWIPDYNRFCNRETILRENPGLAGAINRQAA